MLVSFIVCLAVGVLIAGCGLLIWKKQAIDLVHEYHHRHVSEQDIPAYTRLFGIGCLVMGISCCITGLCNFLFRTELGWIIFAAGFIAGMAIVHKAQKTYNGSWFG